MDVTNQKLFFNLSPEIKRKEKNSINIIKIKIIPFVPNFVKVGPDFKIF